MKKSITRLASIATLTTVALLAQGPRSGERQPRRRGSGSSNPPDVATVVARQVKFLTTLLTLTTAQATQATTIFTAALNAITPLETQITTAETALSTAIKANTTAAITTQATAIGTAQGQIVGIKANADAAFYLSADGGPEDQADQLRHRLPGRQIR